MQPQGQRSSRRAATLCDVTVTETRDLVSALLGVPGVAAAAVEPTSSGPGTLRLQLVPGADEVGVAGAVNRMLRSRFGLAVDADRVRVLGEPPLRPTTPTTTTNGGGRAEVHATTLRAEVSVEPPPVVRPDSAPVAAPPEPAARTTAAPAAPAVPGTPAAPAAPDLEPELWQPTPRRPAAAQPAAPVDRAERGDRSTELTSDASVEQQASTRLLIERVQLASAGLTTSVVVSLRHDGRVVDGRADGTATAGSLHRSVAHATLRAVEQVLGNGVRFDLEHVEIARTGTDRTALVVLTMVTERAQQRLSGASVVREDVRQATIRAVLAAVNRRVEPLIGAGQGNPAE